MNTRGAAAPVPRSSRSPAVMRRTMISASRTRPATTVALLLPDHRGEHEERQERREREQPGRSWTHREGQRERGDQRDAHGERGDRIDGYREAPAGRVRASTVEAMEHRPHLRDVRRDAAKQLPLERETQRPRSDDGGHTLRGVEDSTDDAGHDPDALHQIAAAELPRSDR